MPPARQPATVIDDPAEHGAIVGFDETLPDARGGIGAPRQRRLDTLDRMQREGMITPVMRAAGSRFHDDFRRAALDPLWAPDLARVPVLTHNNRVWAAGRGSAAAHDRVVAAIEALGGFDAPPASCAWYVLGSEWTLSRWGLVGSARGNRDRYVSGILVATLSVLARHYGLN